MLQSRGIFCSLLVINIIDWIFFVLGLVSQTGYGLHHGRMEVARCGGYYGDGGGNMAARSW